MTSEERKIFTEAFQTFGKRNQFVVAIEEMSELIKELTKNLRGADNIGSIAEEIADVEIMLDQIKLMFCMIQTVRNMREFKICRLAERIKEETP